MPPSFCKPPSRGGGRELDASARSFLDHLGLPTVHPLCDGTGSDEIGRGDAAEHVFELPHGNNFTSDVLVPNTTQQQLLSPPEVGSISLLELHDRSVGKLLVTATTMSAPTIAMAELWLRFFAVFLCPICVCYLIQREVKNATTKSKDEAKKSTKCESNMDEGKEDTKTIIVCTVGLASSAVLFTDSLYVYEYGRSFGLSLFLLSSVLAVRCTTRADSSKHNNTKGQKQEGVSVHRLFQFSIFSLIAMTAVVFLRSDGGIVMDSALKRILPTTSSADAADTNNMHNESYNPLEHMPQPGIDLPTISEGTYHSSSNPLISSIVSHWPESSRTYGVANGATPYLVNGDQRTGIPFIVNKVPEQEYVRVWTRNEFDGEYLALDIAFPYSDCDDGDSGGNGADGVGDGRAFVHDLNKPVYLVLHGLNGGSHEEYVKDLVERRRSEGSTVVVFIARGMMDTEMVGWNMFHGARTGDVDAAARAVRDGLDSLAEKNGREGRQVLVGVGYSMGAIILSNYVARSGTHCALDAAMAVSGGLDMRQQLNFRRSMRLWQPMLTFGLREDMLIGKYARHCKERLTEEQFLRMLRVTSISALDVEAIVTYNSFDGLVHYYTETSAMGDRDPEFDLFGPTERSSSWGRMANVSVPFAVLQALDDPLVGWRTVGTNDPQGLADSGSGNVMLVLTKAGGHVGWPLGTNPKKSRWKWMNDAARDFAVAVDTAKRKVKY